MLMRKYTKDKFDVVYARAKNIYHLAELMRVSVVSAYKYCKRYKYHPPGKTAPISAIPTRPDNLHLKMKVVMSATDYCIRTKRFTLHAVQSQLQKTNPEFAPTDVWVKRIIRKVIAAVLGRKSFKHGFSGGVTLFAMYQLVREPTLMSTPDFVAEWFHLAHASSENLCKAIYEIYSQRQATPKTGPTFCIELPPGAGIWDISNGSGNRQDYNSNKGYRMLSPTNPDNWETRRLPNMAARAPKRRGPRAIPTPDREGQ